MGGAGETIRSVLEGAAAFLAFALFVPVVLLLELVRPTVVVSRRRNEPGRA